MSLNVQCRCGKRFAAAPRLAGKQVACPGCGGALTIPGSPDATAPTPQVDRPHANQTAPAANPQLTAVVCSCGKRFGAPPHMAGKRAACPACRQPLLIPGGAAAAPAPRAPVAPAPRAATVAPAPRAPAASAASPPQPLYPVEDWDSLLAEPVRPYQPAAPAPASRGPTAESYASPQRRKATNSGIKRGPIVSGFLSLAGGAIWLVAGLAFDRLYFYPIFLVGAGLLGIIRGLAGWQGDDD